MVEGAHPRIHETLIHHSIKHNSGVEVVPEADELFVEDQIPDKELEDLKARGVKIDRLTEEERTARISDEKKHGSHLHVSFEELYKKKHDLESELGMEERVLRENGAERKIMALPLEREQEIAEILKTLDQKRLKILYRKIFERIADETNYFHQLEEMGIMPNVADYRINDWFGFREIAGVNIKWNSREVRNKGNYDALNNNAKVKRKKPTREEIMMALSTRGMLAGSLRSMTHEISHSFHNVFEKGKKFTMGDYIGVKRIVGQGWSEMAANRTANRPPGTRTKGQLVERQVKKTDKDGNRLYNLNSASEFAEKCVVAIEAIDQLNALGFLPQEIGGLIVDKYFPGEEGNLEEIINREMKSLGIDELDLENLVQADRVEWEIGRMLVMKIAQEEILKLAK